VTDDDDLLWQLVLDGLVPPPDPELEAYAWRTCGDPHCEGLPHEGWPTKHARVKQIAPAWLWLIWLILAGRGFGKTRSGAEWVKDKALKTPGVRGFIAAPTFADARDTCVEGESGLIAITPPKLIKTYNRSLGEIVFTNESRIKLFSGDEPERFRGPQHHFGWFDELAAFRYAQEAWDQAMFGLRLGEHPQVVVTTTPKPTKLIRDLLERKTVHVTRGSTFENRANLAGAALAEFEKLRGTRLGRQELEAEVLLDVPGAIARMEELDRGRVDFLPEIFDRIVTVVDPAVTNTEESDSTGITVTGRVGDHTYLVDDTSMKDDIEVWSLTAVATAIRWGCSELWYESNQGGDAIGVSLKKALERYNRENRTNHFLRIEPVHASQSKYDRALPLQLAIQLTTWHIFDVRPELEEQLTTWVPIDEKGKKMPSPNNMDSAVHGYRIVMNINETIAQPYKHVSLPGRR
jgi:phage terminase large subunit-like protein